MEIHDGKPMLVAPEWIEAHCVIPDGFRAGSPFRLYTYQLQYLAAFYTVKNSTVWNPENPVLGPAFVYRRGLLIGPQKLGKGPHTAAHVCLESVGPALFAGWAEPGDGYACSEQGCRCGWEYEYEPGEPMGMHWPTPLIQITAMSEEQTDNIYGALRPMIDNGPLADIVTRTGEDFIRLPGGGRIDAVTSSAKSRLGQRVTFIPQDEVGLWAAGTRMAAVADTQFRGLAGMGGRASLTSNAWDPAEQSVAQQQFESSATDIYRQMVTPPANLSYRNKVDRRKIHKIVYGEALTENGGHVPLDSVEAEAFDLLERDPAQAERFFGNRIVHGHGAWLADGLWERTQRDQPDASEVRICLGFDGSSTNDWTAIRAETPEGYQFTPTYGPDKRPTIWNPLDWGGRIPRAEVHAAVEELFRNYRVERMYCDPRDWQTEIESWALTHGDERVLPWSTYRIPQMWAALERFVGDLTHGLLTHDDCPHTALHVGNARKVAKPGDRYILDKPSGNRKIDAAVTSALAHEAAADARTAGWTRPKEQYTRAVGRVYNY